MSTSGPTASTLVAPVRSRFAEPLQGPTRARGRRRCEVAVRPSHTARQLGRVRGSGRPARRRWLAGMNAGPRCRAAAGTGWRRWTRGIRSPTAAVLRDVVVDLAVGGRRRAPGRRPLAQASPTAPPKQGPGRRRRTGKSYGRTRRPPRRRSHPRAPPRRSPAAGATPEGHHCRRTSRGPVGRRYGAMAAQAHHRPHPVAEGPRAAPRGVTRAAPK